MQNKTRKTVVTITVLCALALANSACVRLEESIEEKETGTSSIFPPAPLLENLKPIELKKPVNGAGVIVSDAADAFLAFSFDARDPVYSALFIFNAEPVVKDGAITNLKEVCVGGITNMAPNHNWSDAATSIGATAASSYSRIYQCNVSSVTDAFSTTDKLVLDRGTFPQGTTFYWAVLGYDGAYRLTHSSPLRAIVIE